MFDDLESSEGVPGVRHDCGTRFLLADRSGVSFIGYGVAVSTVVCLGHGIADSVGQSFDGPACSAFQRKLCLAVLKLHITVGSGHGFIIQLYRNQELFGRIHVISCKYLLDRQFSCLILIRKLGFLRLLGSFFCTHLFISDMSTKFSTIFVYFYCYSINAFIVGVTSFVSFFLYNHISISTGFFVLLTCKTYAARTCDCLSVHKFSIYGIFAQFKCEGFIHWRISCHIFLYIDDCFRRLWFLFLVLCRNGKIFFLIVYESTLILGVRFSSCSDGNKLVSFRNYFYNRIGIAIFYKSIIPYTVDLTSGLQIYVTALSYSQNTIGTFKCPHFYQFGFINGITLVKLERKDFAVIFSKILTVAVYHYLL